MADNVSFAPEELPSAIMKERACFDGVLLAALSYGNPSVRHFQRDSSLTRHLALPGALLMLYIQLTEVLLRKPKRGKTFWAIVVYSLALFPLSTLAIAGMLKFTQMSYIDNRSYPGGPTAYHSAAASEWVNVMSLVRYASMCRDRQVWLMLVSSTTLIPWLGDILMVASSYHIFNGNN